MNAPAGPGADAGEDDGEYVSHADIGGAAGYGPVRREPEDVVFHHGWEAKALALTLAAGTTRRWNIDTSRSYRETLPDYAELTYFQIWTAALERLIVERGVATASELRDGHASDGPVDGARALTADRVADAMSSVVPYEREPSAPARFAVGQRVRTRAGRVDHHTRLPGYAAGRVGVVERVHGVHVFPDTNAHDLGEQPHWLYNVVFAATDLWPDARPAQRVSIDAWEPYLSPLDDGPLDDADPPGAGRTGGAAP